MRLTLTLVSIFILVFLIQVFSSSLLGLTVEQFFQNFAFSTNNLFDKPWVILTSIFMHGDISHLLSNIIIIVFFGLALEEEIGWRKTFVIFMLGAFAGQFTSIFYYGPEILSVGASAGIFGLIGVGIIMTPFTFKLPNPIPLGLLGIIYAFYNIIGFFSGPSNISFIAHFGGLFIGLAFGFHYKGIKKGLKLIVILSLIFIALLMAIPLILQWIFG